MKKISVFFGSFFAVLLLAFLLFAVIVNFCGRGVTDQPWMLELYPLKNYMAKKQQSPKIIIIGGSSSLFGISGEKLKEYTEMDNVNFSMSIMIPMRFYLTDLEKHVRKGDVVVMPLELDNHYCDEPEKIFSNFGISLLFGCNPETQKTLSFQELCSLYLQYGFSWINTSLCHKEGPLRRFIRKDREKMNLFDGVYKEQYVYELWASLQTKEKRGTRGYYSDLSVYGDWLVDTEARTSNAVPFAINPAVSGEFLSNYRRIRELTESRGATLLLVWPNVYFYPEQSGFAEFKNMLAAHGITIYGRPEAMSFPKYFYHDPTHHMNRCGAELWSYELAKTICQATGRPLKKNNAAWPYVVFADAPEHHFPGVKTALYDTGVRIGKKEFPLVLDVPENLRGKALELNLIALPESKTVPVFSGIRYPGGVCRITETMHSERAEIFAELPAECTNRKKLILICSVNGNSIGMERIFMQEAQLKPTVSFDSGFAAPEPWGRWTDGAQAEIAVFIPAALRGKKVKMSWEIFAFVHPKRAVCKVTVLTGNRKLLERDLTAFNNTLELEVPPEYTKNSRLPLTIQIENPVSPQSLGVSEDPRKLGIGIKEIRFER